MRFHQLTQADLEQLRLTRGVALSAGFRISGIAPSELESVKRTLARGDLPLLDNPPPPEKRGRKR